MTKKTTFKELIGEISDRTDKSHAFTENFMRELVGIIEAGLQSNGSVTIGGFGKFELRWMNERSGINPQTGEEITIPGQNKVVFKPYKALREHVNKPYAQMEAQLLDEGPDSSTGSGSTQSPEKTKKEKTGEDFISEKGSVKDEPFQLEADDKEEEDIDNLVYERPSPIPHTERKTGITKKNNFQSPSPTQVNKSKLAEQVQEESEFRWSYVAVVIVILITIFALIYFSRPDEEPSDPVVTQPPAVTETEPNLSTSNEEPNTEPVESETESIPVVIEPGQSLWSLADLHLDDAYLWPWIYHVNRDNLTDPNVIRTGNELTLPVPSDKDQLTEDENLEVANGYLDVYSWYRDTDSENAKYFLWGAGTYHEDVLEEVEGSVNYNDLFFARNR